MDKGVRRIIQPGRAPGREAGAYLVMRVDSFRGCQLLGREMNGLLWNRVERMIFLSAKRRLTVNYSVANQKKQEKNQICFMDGGITIVQQYSPP